MSNFQDQIHAKNELRKAHIANSFNIQETGLPPIEEIEKANKGDRRTNQSQGWEEIFETGPSGKMEWMKYSRWAKKNGMPVDAKPGSQPHSQAPDHSKPWEFDDKNEKHVNLLKHAEDIYKKKDVNKLISFAKNKSINRDLHEVAKMVLAKHGHDESEYTPQERVKKTDEDYMNSEHAHLYLSHNVDHNEKLQDRINEYRRDLRMFAKNPEKDNMFIYGAGGTGKTWNMRNVFESQGKKEFDDLRDKPGAPDYDWVLKGKVTPTTLIRTLYEHNNKIIVFDDSDGILNNKDAVNTLKRAMDSSDSIVELDSTAKSQLVENPAYDPSDPEEMEKLGIAPEIPMPKRFKFKGKVVFISNKDKSYFTEDDDRNALITRGTSHEFNFTNEQIFDFMKENLSTIKPQVTSLGSQKEDDAEKEEVFKVLDESLDKIPEGKLNMRYMTTLIKKKRAADDDNEEITSENKKLKAMGKPLKPFVDWKAAVIKELLRKGDENEFVSSTDPDLMKALQILGLSVNTNEEQTELSKAMNVLEL